MKFIPFLIFVFYFFTFQNLYSQEEKDSVSEWSATVKATGLYQSGNTNKFYVNGSSEIKRADKLLETILLLSAGYGESKHIKDDNTYFASFTADLFYKDEWSPFFLQYLEYNFSKGITLRSQTGVGVKYLFIKNPNHKTSFSVAGIYDYLKLVDKPGNSKTNSGRLSLRLKSRQSLFEKHLIVLFTILYQPLVKDFSKKNLFIETTLEVPMSSLIKLNIIYNYGFDDVVSVGRKRADNKLTFGAGLYF